MSITILVERDGIRAHRTVYDSISTRIPGVAKIRWHGTPAKSDREYYSLTHIGTGRALNMIPLTTDEADRLVDALMDCPIEWDRIDVSGDEWPGRPWFTDNLSDEARRLAGAF
jgi:hypothetical protein